MGRTSLPLLVVMAIAATTPSAQAAPSAAGDFNGDGESDLAIGAPLDSVAGRSNAGAVNVIYGSERSGLREDPDQQFTQDTRGIRGAADAHDRFGSALATGDFDGDGFGDLAIGSPGEDIAGVRNTGVVQVLYGRRGRLTVEDDMFGQGFAGIPGTREAEQNFGAALAVGDFDGDGEADLAVGTPFEDIGADANAGAVNILYGSQSSGIYTRDDFWSQGTRGIKGLRQAFDNFALAIATGDFDRDGYGDLAVGSPGDSVAGFGAAGAVNVIHGARGGLREDRDQLWTQGTRGIKGAVGDDWFGAVLAG
jgi:hypothetical protein